MTRKEDLILLNRRTFMKSGIAATAYSLLGSNARGKSIHAKVPVFDVLKFGAAGDGKTLDSAAIQRGIDEAAAAGRRAQVLLRGGKKFLTGTLKLKGNVDFHLGDDAELLVSTDPAHYTGAAVLTATEANGLTISGTGRLNGRAREFMTHFDEKDEWWRPKQFRPKMFVLNGCKDLEVRDVTMFEAPEWGLHMLGCERVLVERMKIRNLLDVPNCDGIDPDHCRDVEIKDCDIVCGDDAIVIKATRQGMKYGPSSKIRVKDCVIDTQDSGLKIGTETTQDIHDVVFERCEIKSSCRGLTIQLRDEGNVYDVMFRDIRFVSRYHSDPWWGRGEAISFTAIPRTKETKLGTISNVTVRNVTGRSENSARINGSPESRVKNVTFDNVALTLDRWTKYRGGLFDNRPTSVIDPIEMHGNPGIHVRNADAITLKNCSVGWGKNIPDYFTHAIEAENVGQLNISGFKGKAARPVLKDIEKR